MKPLVSTLVLALGLTIAQTTFAQVRPAPGEPPAGNENVEILHVQGNVWLLAGAGGNIAVQEGEQGVIVVDQRQVGQARITG